MDKVTILEMAEPMTSRPIGRLARGLATLALAACLLASSREAQSAPPSEYADQVQVVSAAGLIGREIRDADGHELGFIDYVLFDVATGAVRDVILAPAVDLQTNGDFIAIPWKMLARPLPRPAVAVRATIRRAQVGKLMDLNVDEVLTQGKPQRAPLAFATNPLCVRCELTAANAPAGTAFSRPIISGEDLEALTITDPSGRTLASIDTVMIDVTSGRVAYFTAIPAAEPMTQFAVVAVPFESLRWSAANDTYDVTVHGGLHPSLVPSLLVDWPSQRTIDRSLLAALYTAYGVPGYWASS